MMLKAQLPDLCSVLMIGSPGIGMLEIEISLAKDYLDAGETVIFVTMDMLPTLAHVAGLPRTEPAYPVDGTDILDALNSDTATRHKPIPFRYQGKAAWVDFPYKLVSKNYRNRRYELYNLQTDPLETTDLFNIEPVIAQRLVAAFEAWSLSVDRSHSGHDYAGGLRETDPPA